MPRPIALVTTRCKAGVLNAAPFSFFNVFSENPALVILGLEVKRDDDTLKDTTNNIKAAKELVINLVDKSLAKPMVQCAAALAAEEDEFEFAGVTSIAFEIVSVPGIAESPVRLECTLFELRPITPRRHLRIAEVKTICAHDSIIDSENLRVNIDAYRPIARLMGKSYAELGEILNLSIPAAPQKEAP